MTGPGTTASALPPGPLVVAVGGNALARRGEPVTTSGQRAAARRAASALAPLASGRTLVITHGNGPQVGLLAAAAEAAGHPVPLDILDAETQGQIGYLLELELADALPGREVATLLTQVLVAEDDPAFATPTKPIGAVFDETTARGLAREHGWTVAADGPRWRRVVPSPEPRGIRQEGSVRTLLAAGTVVICAGGGGIPVATTSSGRHVGREAVVDKDLVSALLARRLGAEGLVLLTDVGEVQSGWGTPRAAPIHTITVSRLREMDLEAGSMGPKAEAAARFVEATGRSAHIGALDRAVEVAAGRSGTCVLPDDARAR